MGSLPNLHEIEKIKQRRERQKELECLRKMVTAIAREREQIDILTRKKTSTNRSGGHETNKETKLPENRADDWQRDRSNEKAATACGPSAWLENGPYSLARQYERDAHRRSLPTRHRVLRTHSTGNNYSLGDEEMMERLTACSPISTRSYRINPLTAQQLRTAMLPSGRRRESVNSSVGANSIRRLIALNSRKCRHKVPQHVRRKIYQNFTFFALAHGLMGAIILPMFGLQGSNSVWYHSEKWLQIGPDFGSLMLGIMALISAGMCLATKWLVRKFGHSLPVAANHVAVAVFVLGHLYPSIYLLLPAYVILGLTLSSSYVCKIALIAHYGSRLSCSHHESIGHGHGHDSLDEYKLICSHETKVRRLARWYHFANDLGTLVGALVTSMVLSCSPGDWYCLNFGSASTARPMGSIAAADATNQTFVQHISVVDVQQQDSQRYQTHALTSLFEDFYLHNEHGERICGADMCPSWPNSNVAMARHVEPFHELAPTGLASSRTSTASVTLLSLYLCFAIASVMLTVLIGKVQTTFRRERNKGVTDTILFAGPMAYFIGTEQAYMLSDFLRAFVSCTLGINMVAGALVGMGIMQLIVSCTLSMLLRHTKRIVVIVAAFFFHSCLLLALSYWKPSSDDSALFYVLAASWGACNGMWETLLLSLISLNHTNHVTEVAAPLQGLRFLGLGVTFVAHGFMCEMPKIIILVIILVVSVPPYAMLEMRLETQRKSMVVYL